MKHTQEQLEQHASEQQAGNRKLTEEQFQILAELNDIFQLMEKIEFAIAHNSDLRPLTQRCVDDLRAFHKKWLAE